MTQKWKRRVCGKECTTDRLARNSGFARVDSSLGEVHEVVILASDAPGSLFGELEKITRDSGHHSYLAHELLQSFLSLHFCLAHKRFTTLTATSKGLATASLFSGAPRFVLRFLVPPQSQFVLSPLSVVQEPLGVGGQPWGSL